MLSDFLPTGVPGLDELLSNKGIPRGHVVLVLGVPGSGKTTLGLQFLVKGAERREPGIYVTLDEHPDALRSYARGLGLPLERFEEEGLISFIDASPIRHIPGEVKLWGVEIGKRQLALASLIMKLNEAVEKTRAQRVVIDPLSTLMVQYPNVAEMRTAFLDLLQAVSSARCTSLFISELAEASLKRPHSFEEYLAHGVIVMTRLLTSGGFVRVFLVEKMRGLQHDEQPHPYRIGPGGVEVYHTEPAF
jgi:KaiC/GvpD/RAD55 family RecA-like ATPase